jgi:AcrR family transcriptional regulator
MRQTTIRGADTRLRMIQVAADLFHRKGIHATSPDEIIEASRTGKGQFYHYFKSKQGLVREVLKTHLDAINKGTSPINYGIQSWGDLETWFLAHLEQQKRFGMTRGCPFGTIGNGLTDDDEAVRQDLALVFEVVKNKLAAFFIREKARGRLAAEAHEDQLADFCLATVQGAMLMGKIRHSSETVESTVSQALAYLRTFAADGAPAAGAADQISSRERAKPQRPRSRR